MLSMFTDTTMPGRDMATMLPRLGKSSRHIYGCLTVGGRCWVVVVEGRGIIEEISVVL
jgi:hypothetical protein